MNEKPQLDNSVRPTRLPPIRIFDLMVLTATMAFVFVFQENRNRLQDVPAIPPLLEYSLRMMLAIQSGITLAAGYWLIQQKRTTGKFFQQPGHWIFSGFMISMLGSLLVLYFFDPGDGYSGNDKVADLFRGFAFVQFMGSIMLFYAMCRTAGRWRWVLGIIAWGEMLGALSCVDTALMISNDFSSGTSSIDVFSSLISALQMISTPILLLILAIVVIVDWKQRRSRDWLHWAAVVVVLLQSLVNPILSWLMGYYMNLNY